MRIINMRHVLQLHALPAQARPLVATYDITVHLVHSDLLKNTIIRPCEVKNRHLWNKLTSYS